MADEAAAQQTKLKPLKVEALKASRRLSAVCLAASSAAATLLLLLRGPTCCLGVLSPPFLNSDLILHASLSIAPHSHPLLFFWGWVSLQQRDERLRCKAQGSYSLQMMRL